MAARRGGRFGFPEIDWGSKRSHLLGGAVEGFDALFLSESLAQGDLKQVFWIVRGNLRADSVLRAVKFFAPSLESMEIPAWDCLPYDRLSPDAETAGAASSGLACLSEKPKRAQLVIVPVQMALRRVPPPSVMREAGLSLREGEEIGTERIRDYLETWGYRRVDVASLCGDYAVRGGLLDIYPPGGEPLRLDMFGERIEKIRHFDAASQRTIGKKEGGVSRATLYPASEIGVCEESAGGFRERWRAHFGREGVHDPIYEAMGAGQRLSGLEQYLPFFYERMETLFSYIPKDAVIALDAGIEEGLIRHWELVQSCHQERVQSLAEAPNEPPWRPLPPKSLWVQKEEWESLISSRINLKLSPFVSEDSHDLGGREGKKFSGASHQFGKEFPKFIKQIQSRAARLCFLSPNEAEAKSFEKMLHNYGVKDLQKIKNWEEIKNLPAASPAHALLPLEKGFEAPGLCVITESDLLGVKMRRHLRRPRDNKEILRRFQSLSEGDLVVHLDHGIGRFKGLRRIEAAGEEHECFEIIYQGEDRLLLPVENAELLSRYGGDSAEATLDRLGAASWQARRAGVKKRIQVLAHDLIELAAKREASRARKIIAPAGLYDEFCARFPFETTEDQEKAAEDVLEDLQSGVPMDRLICGDVGFGKTEIALRAAFLTAMSGHQTAIITPTTLLCRQHVETFHARFEGSPVKIGHISRLVGEKDAEEAREAMEDGSLDIVIGTHALLSKRTRFKDLGLLVVDEEQHFGVAHKERLKSFRENVHLLTLTATPIPRTLQFALSGARDISLIATPPTNRMNVRSFIGPFDVVSLRRSLMREKERGGQSFVIAPRIKDLGRMEEFLAKHLPEVSFLTLHGQLKPESLEKGIAAFYDGEVDVLLSTNIVESGLDIPRANTIIVYRAHMFGLAQLHQLRGRVGRSDRQAYSYFTLPENALSKNAEQRLAALQSVDSLGAGFSLAAQDLDMRGAGNLLGSEQSGHIAEVGFELYQKMLQEAVRNLQSADSQKDSGEASFSPVIEVGVSALLPSSYIAELSLRLRLYRRIAEMESFDAIQSFQEEMRDRFGEMPPQTEALLKVAALKILCRRAGVSSLRAGSDGCSIRFHKNRFANPSGLAAFLQKEKDVRLRRDHALILKKRWSPSERIGGLMKFLAQLANIAENAEQGLAHKEA